MKTMFVLFTAFIFSSALAQDSKIFSSFDFGISAGSNFKTLTYPGASLLLEVRTPLAENLSLKLSGGFSLLFEDKSFVLRHYKFFSIQGIEGYSLNTQKIDKIEHSVIPFYVGAEYVFLKSDLSPFALLDIGYVYYTTEFEQSSYTTGERFDTIEEIPEEYRVSPPRLRKTGTFFGAGIGAGLKYKLTKSTELSLVYVFRYNDKIINSNNVLLGISF